MTATRPSNNASGDTSVSRKRVTAQDALKALARIEAGRGSRDDYNLVRAVLQQAQIEAVEDDDLP